MQFIIFTRSLFLICSYSKYSNLFRVAAFHPTPPPPSSSRTTTRSKFLKQIHPWQTQNNKKKDKHYAQIPFTTRLYDISEWRDLMFEPPAVINDLLVVKNQAEEHRQDDGNNGPLREICILPFPLQDVILQGETKELCLYEQRFHDLFEKSMSDHGGVIAMGLLDPPASILQTMPLCEIESYQKMEGDTGFGTSFSILATIRVVGRCSLLCIEDDGGDGGNGDFLTGWCREVSDDVRSVNGKTSTGRDIVQLGNDLADRMESVFESIIRLENELDEMESDNNDDDDDMDEPSDATIKRMLLEAELDDDEEEEDEEDNYEDDDTDEEDDDSLRIIFQRALQDAKASDTQGYKISSNNNSTIATPDNIIRPVQELTALSWAYFSNDLWSSDILHFRLKALEVDELCERMKVALVMMMEHRSKLKETLKKSRGSN